VPTVRQSTIVGSGGEVPPDDDEWGPLVRVPTNGIIDWLVSKEIDPTQAIDTAIKAGWISPIGSIIETQFGKRTDFRRVSAKVLNIKPKAKSHSKGRERETEPEQWGQLVPLWARFKEECKSGIVKKLTGDRMGTIEHFVYWAKLQGYKYDVATVRKIKKAEWRYRRNQRRN
jgi:hypothetical protein